MDIRKLGALTAMSLLAMSLAACENTGSPTRENVQKGYISIVKDSLEELNAGVTSDAIDDYAACLVDATFDQLSESGLSALANQDFSEAFSDDDVTLISDASDDCSQYIEDSLDEAEASSSAS
ncbi:hypothetical protein [Changpingibacter yushuensis]|uniref:hypothetical protein n=1 Tax=Changpingibacter yushuensis TaxID=2758440 RepID=UPI00165EBBCA|nr:hypothetical protein [Changpingibacter yushuensis]